MSSTEELTSLASKMSLISFDQETATELDSKDPLSKYRSKFHIPLNPNDKSKVAIYMTGNSLGPQPKETRAYLEKELKKWEELAVESWFHKEEGFHQWINFDRECIAQMAKVVGAKDVEVTVMNSLTVNLHLMLSAFYNPEGKRHKILMEDGAFPSDAIAIKSHIRNHKLNPETSLILVKPREGEDLIREEDLYNLISQHGDELALVFLGGVNYLTGQLFDMAKITELAHSQGALVGFDLAHGAGNIKLQLHEWGPDFAVWCTYKYLNSGPGGIGACFIHERHCNDTSRPRLSGWWSHEPSTRFLMKPELIATEGASGFQISTPPILLLASLKASLSIFSEVGMDRLVEKSRLMTAFMEKGLEQCDFVTVITPKDPSKRGCQLSLIFKSKYAKEILEALKSHGVICDFREPNCIRAAPCPLYTRFQDVYDFVKILTSLLVNNA